MSAARARSRAWVSRARSSLTSGTIRLAASVGVEARKSATRSSSGVSRWCPIALTRGVRQAAATRTRDSLLNGSRSSNDPPPRATTITSTRGSRSSSAIAALTSGTARGPCTVTRRISNCTADQRARALDTTSCSASPCCATISPTTAGRNGSARLRDGSNSPSAPSTPLRCSIRASSSPSPTSRTSSAANVSVPFLAWNCGRACTTRCAPSASLSASLSMAKRRGRDRQGHVEVGVPQRQEVEGVPPLQVQHLPLDPDRRHLRDVVGDLRCQVPHRPGAVGGGVRRAQRGGPAVAGVLRGPVLTRPACLMAPTSRPRRACDAGRAGRVQVTRRGAPPSRADAARRSETRTVTSPTVSASGTPTGHVRHRQARPAGRPPRLLRRRRPRGHRRREGARALRRARVRAQGDRAQQVRRRDAAPPAAPSS